MYLSRFLQYFLLVVIPVVTAQVINAIINSIALRAYFAAIHKNPYAAFSAMGGTFAVKFFTGIIQWAAVAIAIGLVIKAVEAHLEGRTLSLGENFKAITPVLGNLLVASLIFGLAVGLGTMLLIIPGLAALFFFYMTPQAVVIDKMGAFQALGRSAQLALKVPGEVIVILVIAFVYGMIVGLITGGAAFTVGFHISAGYYILQIVGGLLSAVATAWVGIAMTLAYKRAKELA